MKLMNFQVGMCVCFFSPGHFVLGNADIPPDFRGNRHVRTFKQVDLAVCLEVGYPISYGIINSIIKITRTLGSISKKEIVG